MNTNAKIQNNAEPILEGRQKHRDMFKERTRKKLQTYVGKVKGKLVAEENQLEMDEDEFQELLDEDDLPQSFRNIMEFAGPLCPLSLRKILSELSTPNPTCGVFQFCGADGQIAREVLEDITRGDFTRSQTTHYDHLKMYAPLFVELVITEYFPQYLISPVIEDILNAIDAPFNVPQGDDTQYGRAATVLETPLDYFPTKPTYLGTPNYSADKTGNQERGNCTKIVTSTRHRTLSPGVFTLFCRHGLCIGFQMMESHESPQTGFHLLMTRFPKMPEIVVYDNCCHFHKYCLKREPKRFKNVTFLIDRLHDKGHLCTDGYSMSTYKHDKKISSINSQLVEQANSKLKNLNSQIANMTSDNAIIHLAVFLGIRNMSKNVELMHTSGP